MDEDDYGPTCPDCGETLEHEDCDACGGAGFFDDLHELDPLWYAPGATEACQQCSGTGGWWLCPNRRCGRGVVEVV